MKNPIRVGATLLVIAAIGTVLGTSNVGRFLLSFVEGILLLPLVVLGAGIVVVDTVRVYRYVKGEISRDE